MRRFVLSVIACLMVVWLMARAVDPAPVVARPAGAAHSALATAAAADSPAPLEGFSTDSARAERDWESKFRALPSPANLRSYMQRISTRPHHVGTEYDRANAEWILSLFQQWGWDAHIENFDVLFPTPKERLVNPGISLLCGLEGFSFVCGCPLPDKPFVGSRPVLSSRAGNGFGSRR